MGYGRKRRGSAKEMLTLLLLLLLIAFVLYKFVFVVREIRVEGNSKLTAEEVIQSAEIQKGKFIYAVREEAVAESILEDGKAKLKELKIELPSTVVLTVEERESAAIMLYAGNMYVLDADCVVMEKTDTAPEGNLLYVTGLDVKSAVVGSVLQAKGEQVRLASELISLIRQSDRAGYVSEIDVSNSESLRLYSGADLQIKLGRGDMLEKKITIALRAIQDMESRGETKGIIDVSSGESADYQPDGKVERNTL